MIDVQALQTVFEDETENPIQETPTKGPVKPEAGTASVRGDEVNHSPVLHGEPSMKKWKPSLNHVTGSHQPAPMHHNKDDGGVTAQKPCLICQQIYERTLRSVQEEALRGVKSKEALAQEEEETFEARVGNTLVAAVLAIIHTFSRS
jgi:hypothetical protein